ncbi:hypothetical protein B0H14DRAFT_2593754 [Mycena olivaceomarginata]|nr:hypothetical protein B0H14DRAFT_2593754 [Mycena olivaceomarginata]
MSPSFPCIRLFYLSSVAPLDFRIELCATFPLTLCRHNRLVPLPIIRSADQQPSIFHQKIKAADPEDRARIVDAICADGGEILMHRSGSAMTPFSAVSKPPRAPRNAVRSSPTCELEGTRLRGGSLLADCVRAPLGRSGDDDKHASHMWSKITELSWTPPAAPIFASVNKSLKGKWTPSPYHETGSLVPQVPRPRETRGERQDGIIDEPLAHGAAVFGEVAKSPAGLLLHLAHPRTRVGEAPLNGARAPPHCPARVRDERPVLVMRQSWISLLFTRSELIASVLLTAKDRCTALYDCIRAQIACKTGSKVIWLLVFFSSDRIRAYYGY